MLVLEGLGVGGCGSILATVRGFYPLAPTLGPRLMAIAQTSNSRLWIQTGPFPVPNPWPPESRQKWGQLNPENFQWGVSATSGLRLTPNGLASPPGFFIPIFIFKLYRILPRDSPKILVFLSL